MGLQAGQAPVAAPDPSLNMVQLMQRFALAQQQQALATQPNVLAVAEMLRMQQVRWR